MIIDQRIEAIDSYSTANIDSQVNNLATKKGNKCKGCNRSFCSMGDLKLHIKTIHLKLKRFRCKICNYATYYKKGIHAHMKTHSENSASRKPNPSINQDTLNKKQVDDSQKSQSDLKKLNSYNRYLFRNNKSQCHICKRILRGRYSAKNHIRAVHLKIKPHKCSVCSHRSLSQCDLRKHMRVHGKSNNSMPSNEAEVGSSSQAEILKDSLASDEVNFFLLN